MRLASLIKRAEFYLGNPHNWFFFFAYQDQISVISLKNFLLRFLFVFVVFKRHIISFSDLVLSFASFFSIPDNSSLARKGLHQNEVFQSFSEFPSTIVLESQICIKVLNTFNKHFNHTWLPAKVLSFFPCALFLFWMQCQFLQSCLLLELIVSACTLDKNSALIWEFYISHKMRFSIKDFSSKCEQIRTFLRISSHLQEKSLTLKRLGGRGRRMGESQFDHPCGFSKIVSSRERMKPWFFVTFNVILKHIFPENFTEFPQHAQKIWRISLSILTIFIKFPQFFGFFDITVLQRN